jgi:hypothetical protein
LLFIFNGGIVLSRHNAITRKECEVGKNEAKTTLRYPQKLKEEFKKIAEEEGLSENAALVQALVWALKFRGQMHAQ